MTVTLNSVLHYLFSFLYGLFLTVSFAGVRFTRRSRWACIALAVALLALVGGTSALGGVQSAYRLYPLLVHLPLVLFLVFYFRCSSLAAIVSTMSAYLCCQLPRWVSKLAGCLLNEYLYIEGLTYVLAAVLFAWFFLRYAAKPVHEIMQNSRCSLITYGMVPLIYYVFDYVTTVYTNLLYSGNWYVVQFMPSVISIFYFLFIIAYYKESLVQIEAQRERDLFGAQLRRSSAEISALRRSQQDAAAYRHDMRHHMNLLQEYAQQGDLEKIQDYLRQVTADLDHITPRRFCANEPVNLICSHYAHQAEQHHIRLSLDIRLPADLSIPEPQLCALLSNALENAVNAVKSLTEERRSIHARLYLQQHNLLIAVENPIDKPVLLVNGLPQSTMPGHGYGTRSISAIVKNNKGQLLYTTEDGMFRLKIVIPLGAPIT